MVGSNSFEHDSCSDSHQKLEEHKERADNSKTNVNDKHVSTEEPKVGNDCAREKSHDNEYRDAGLVFISVRSLSEIKSHHVECKCKYESTHFHAPDLRRENKTTIAYIQA